MATIPGCFACHVDCATGCATDDQPYNHPDFTNYKYHPPSFDEEGLRSRNHSLDSNLSEKGEGVEHSGGAQGPVSVVCLCARVCLWRACSERTPRATSVSSLLRRMYALVSHR